MHKEKNIPDNAKIEAALKYVKNRLLVFSGKGGVGKSTVAANLAMALSEKGFKVGLLDVDLHGPNLAKMLGGENRKVKTEDEKIIPVDINENLKLISMAFFIEKIDSPVVWRGPMKMKAIQQFLEDVAWGELDWLICDSPPGTGDEPLSIAGLIPATAAIIVTTPQEVSLLDSRKAISFSRMLKLDLLGIVENMSGFICPHCGEKVDIFKSGGGEKMAGDYDIPFLGRIPIDPGIVESGDSGQPFVSYRKESEAARAFSAIVGKIIN
jgi:ATP-binding protein involved in chromosome partitioning